MIIKGQTADQLHRTYLIVMLAVLMSSAAIVSTFTGIWAHDPSRVGLHWPERLATVAVVVTGIIAAIAAMMALHLVLTQLTSPLRRHLRVLAFLSESAFWAFVAAAGLCWFTYAYVVEVRAMPFESQIAAFWRASTLTSGLSILMPLLLLLLAFYVWCTWNIRRLKMQVYTRSERAIFTELLTGRDPAVNAEYKLQGGAFRRRLKWATAEIAPWDRLRGFCWLAPLAVLATVVVFAPDRLTAVDGRGASWLLWWCSVWGLVFGADAAGRGMHQGFVLLETLRRLKAHPVSGAFARVASKPLDWRLRLSPLKRLALAPLMADMRMLERGLAIHEPNQAIAFPDLTAAGSVGDWDAETPVQATEQWPAITRGVEDIYRMLSKDYWSFTKRFERGDQTPDRSALTAAEDVVAYCTAFVLRNLLARVIAGLTAGLGIVGLVGFAHLLYPFQGRHFWLTVDLTMFVATAVVVCVILIRLERDPVLSTLWEKTTGRINWTSGLVYRIVITAAVPALLLIASFFPEVAGSLAGMLEPLQKALP